jgi:hypothetical protein
MRWGQFQDVLPVITLALGYVGTFVTERLRDRNERRRGRTTAIADFERALLLDTQEALYQYVGEMQDFAYALRGVGARSYGQVVETSWRAGARLEMLATRLESDRTRETIGEVLGAGMTVSSEAWPDGIDEWTDDERALLDKLVDAMLECEQRAASLLGNRLRALTYGAR